MEDGGFGGFGREWSRRWFMATTAGMAAGAALSGCAAKKPNSPDYIFEPLPPTRVYPKMPDAVVGMAGLGGPDDDEIERGVREAVAAAGGLEEIESGQRVLIKPNLCGPEISGRIPKGRITTNPEVLRAVIRLVKERGAGEVIVSDRGMLATNVGMKWAGFAKVCKEEGAVCFPWTKAEYIRFHPGRRHWSQGFRFPKVLTEVDHFINLPILKNHGAVQGVHFTCCMKSFVGVAFPDDRHQGGDDELHDLRIGEKIAELNLCARPTINIVDATQIMVRGGPDGMSKKNSIWVDANLVLAGKDRVATDSVALSVLKRHAAENSVDLPYVEMSVWDQPQLYYAAELGLGQADPAHIKIEDVNVPLIDEFKDNWK